MCSSCSTYRPLTFRTENSPLSSGSGFQVGWVLRNAAVNFLCESCHNKETSLSAQELRTAGRFGASSALEVTWQLTSEWALIFFFSGRQIVENKPLYLHLKILFKEAGN